MQESKYLPLTSAPEIELEAFLISLITSYCCSEGYVFTVMWTNGVIAAAVVGSVVALVVVCCWLSSLVQCVQHMYKYWCRCCHKKHKDYYGVRTLRHHTRVFFNPGNDTTTTSLNNRVSLPPSYSSIFKQELMCSNSSQQSDTDRPYTSVVVHHCGNGDYASSLRYTNDLELGQLRPDAGLRQGATSTTTTITSDCRPSYHQHHLANDCSHIEASDSMSFCPSHYSLDREVYSKRPHYYQLVFTQSPDDDEAEYPEVDAPFISFPRRNIGHFDPYFSPSGFYKPPGSHSSSPRDIYSSPKRSVMSSPQPDVLRETLPAAGFVSPPGADVYQYVKRPNHLSINPNNNKPLGANKRQCVHVLNNSLFNQCRLAFMSDKPDVVNKPETRRTETNKPEPRHTSCQKTPTPTAPTIESPKSNGNRLSR